MAFDNPYQYQSRHEKVTQTPQNPFWGLFGQNPFPHQEHPAHHHETPDHLPHHHKKPGHLTHHHERAPEHLQHHHQTIDRTPHPQDHPAKRHAPTEWLPRLDITHSETRDGNHTVNGVSRDNLYSRQFSATTCMPTSLAMAEAQFKTGHRPSPERISELAGMTGTTNQGYRRGLEGVKHDAERLGMHAEVHSHSMDELDHELDKGKGAIIRVLNPHTGNPHYVYCFGRDQSGNYIIGDPDRKNNGARGHDRPISRDYLWSMMKHRDGFVSVSS